MALALTPAEWALATSIVLAGTVLQGSIGFGVALIGAPLLYLVEPKLIPAPMIIAGFAAPLLIFWRERVDVVYREVGLILPGAVVGVVAGWGALRVLSADALGLLFGALVLVAVALSAFARLPRSGPRILAAAGALTGFMATTTSIGGPPLALALQHRKGPTLRGTMSACFVPLGVAVLTAHYFAGRLGAGELGLGLSLLPAVLVGFAISGKTARALDRHWLRPAVLVVSASAAIAAIVRALL